MDDHRTIISNDTSVSLRKVGRFSMIWLPRWLPASVEMCATRNACITPHVFARETSALDYPAWVNHFQQEFQKLQARKLCCLGCLWARLAYVTGIKCGFSKQKRWCVNSRSTTEPRPKTPVRSLSFRPLIGWKMITEQLKMHKIYQDLQTAHAS